MEAELKFPFLQEPFFYSDLFSVNHCGEPSLLTHENRVCDAEYGLRWPVTVEDCQQEISSLSPHLPIL